MKKMPFLKIAGLILILLVGCNKQSITPTITPVTEPSIYYTIVEECTLLDCASSVEVALIGQIPENYTLEFTGAEERMVSTTCVIGNYAPPAKIYYTGVLSNQELTRDWPLQNIPNFHVCDNNNGYYSIWYHVPGDPISINKQCAGQPNYDFLHYSRCVYDGVIIDRYEGFVLESVDLGVILSGFSPDRLEINFLSGATNKVVLLEPAYRIEQPNGPQCEPTCKYAEVKIEIP